VVVAGKPTVWCAQYDEKTLAPAMARKYELVSLSGSESVGIVRFLMGIEHPSPEVVRAVEGAVEWFNASKITGIRIDHKPEPGSPKGWDSVVVEDASAPPLWARFYEIGSNRPMFSGRDSVKKYSLAEIEYERRNGYRWYVDRPAKLISDDYPLWKRRNAGPKAAEKKNRHSAFANARSSSAGGNEKDRLPFWGGTQNATISCDVFCLRVEGETPSGNMKMIYGKFQRKELKPYGLQARCAKAHERSVRRTGGSAKPLNTLRAFDANA